MQKPKIFKFGNTIKYVFYINEKKIVLLDSGHKHRDYNIIEMIISCSNELAPQDKIVACHKKLLLNSLEYSKFKLKIIDGMVPYQNRDLREIGIVKYETSNNILNYYANRIEYLDLLRKNGLKYFGTDTIDLPSDIDIFRMGDRIPETKYKYLIQRDPVALKSLKNLDNIIGLFDQDPDSPNIFFVFRVNKPYQEVLKDVSYYDVGLDKKFKIYGYNLFFQEIKKETFRPELSDERFGLHVQNIKDDFMVLLDKYRRFIHDNLVTPIDLDAIIKYEWQKLKGFNSEQLRNAVNLFHEYLMKYDKLYYDEKFDTSQDCGHPHSKKCYYNQLKLHKMAIYNSKIWENKDILEICAQKYAYSMIDLPELANCKTKFNYIFDNEMTIKMIKEKFDIDLNYDNDKTKRYNVLEYLMPEWYQCIMQPETTIQELFDKRQFVLGVRELTIQLKECNLIARIDSFISTTTGLYGIQYNVDINKIIVACSLHKDLIFPIKMILNQDKIGKYNEPSPQDLEENYLTGSLLTRARGTRSDHKNRYYNIFCYYEKYTRPDIPGYNTILLNYRSNIVSPGHVIENFRLLAIELNVIYYYQQDMGVKFNIYQYDEETYYISKYNKSEIKNMYHKMSAFQDKLDLIDSLIDSLKLVYLRKDPDYKYFYIDTMNP